MEDYIVNDWRTIQGLTAHTYTHTKPLAVIQKSSTLYITHWSITFTVLYNDELKDLIEKDFPKKSL